MIAEAWARRRYPAAFINKIDEALGEAMETQACLITLMIVGIWIEINIAIWTTLGKKSVQCSIA
jgi:four helix bundle protein